MKKYILFMFCLFIFPLVVNANSVSNINMNIYIDNNGNATITEIWDAILDYGTEGYHPYYNLGEAYISDVNVSMDGHKFETVDSWNINNSFSEKAYKAGLYEAGSGEYDICFGISEYGTHQYSISYKINNFIVRLNDADMLYWNLFPKDFNTSPNKIDIIIYGDSSYSDSLDVWGYGKYGAPVYVSDGKIHMSAEGITGNEYLTLLVKYPSGTFNTNYIIDKKFNYYLKMANKNASKFKDFFTTLKSKLNRKRCIALFEISICVIIFIMMFVKALKDYLLEREIKHGKKYYFGKKGNKIRDEINFFRDIPCNGDLFRAYWVAKNYNIIKKDEDFFGAILMKWLKDGNIKIEMINDNKVKGIEFVSQPEGNLEEELYKLLFKSSGFRSLDYNKFEQCCDTYALVLLGYFSKIEVSEKNKLLEEGKIRLIQVKKSICYEVDESMMEEAKQLLGLKKFLKEFSIIKERKPIEISLWQEYLVYAQMFGIAEEVAKQFKKFYPEINVYQNNFDPIDISFINMFSKEGIASARRSVTSGEISERVSSFEGDRDSHSSGGGGSGSFGGGAGGGGFR